MKFIRFIVFLFPIFVLEASSTLQFTSPAGTSGGSAQRAIGLANGNVLVAGWYSSDADQHPFVEILSSSGARASALQNMLGGGNTRVLDAAADSNGDIWIAGVTDSDDFPLVHSLFSAKASYQSTGFVAKLDPMLNIVFSTLLGGNGQAGPPATSTPTNVVIDSAGNAYVAGHTGEAAFPTTGPVFGAGAPGATNESLAPLIYGFIVKISSDGSRLDYSRLLGGDQVTCQSSKHCPGPVGNTIPADLAVDASGSVTIAGATDAANFPVTAGAYQTACGCSDGSSNGFVSRISPAGTALTWSTFVGGAVQSIALDGAANVYAVGASSAAELSSDGSSLLYAAKFDGGTFYGLTLDDAGTLWIAGHTSAADFPGRSGSTAAPIDFALQLDSTASVTKFIPLVPGTVTQRPAFDTNGDLMLLSSRGSLLRLDPATAATEHAVLAVTNAAVLTAEPGLAPGEIATLFGVDLGPSAGISATPDANGLFPKQLGGVSIQFGEPGPTTFAPILYAGPNQINFQVPFGFFGNVTAMVTTSSGKVVTLAAIPKIQSVGIFQQAGSNYAAALNEDGTINSASNPAKAGSVVSLFVTGVGGGIFFATEQDGAVWSAPSPVSLGPALGMDVLFNGLPGSLPLLYAGAAPGLINGVLQFNVQLPAQVYGDPTLVVQIVGTEPAKSNAVRVYVSR